MQRVMFSSCLFVFAVIVTPTLSSGYSPPWFSPPWYSPGDNPGSSSNNIPGYYPPWNSPGDSPGSYPSWNTPGDYPGSSPPWFSPGDSPGSETHNRPAFARPNRPGPNPSGRPGFAPGGRPGFGSGNRPGFGSGNRPGFGSGNRPGFPPGNRPGFNPGNRPGTAPGNKPGSTPNNPAKTPTPDFQISVVDAADVCIPAETCDETASFRTINGSCNNLRFPMWGQSSTAYSRLAQAQFSDGVNGIRQSKSGKSLPSPRTIVNKVFSINQIPDNINALALMTVGQLVTHDGSAIPAPATAASCCTSGRNDCFNIDVPADDPYYSQFNVTCLPLQRTPTTESIGCSLKPVYTMTFSTHFIDASFVYGASDSLASSLRQGTGGLLRSQTVSGKVFPPLTNSPDALCLRNAQGQITTKLCMQTGDDRTNQNPPLSSLQVVALREHNRIATELAEINPSWDDDRLYEESRRVLIAEWQVISYRDYLPLVIGEAAARETKLLPVESGMSSAYDQFLNPSTTNDFTTAAFRVFHSQIPSAYCTKGGQTPIATCPFGANNFSNSLNDPEILAKDGGLDAVLLGMNQQHAAKVMDRFTREMSGNLFRFGQKWGQDLVSIDIQRGRDTGIAPYNTYRTLCGKSAATEWDDFLDAIDKQDIEKMQQVYEAPGDVDLFVAGILERKQPGSLVGPTFQCLIVDQFKRWKEGDRFFYDLEGFTHSFRVEQVDALRNASLSRWFCDNGDNIQVIPTNIFLTTSPQVPCDAIPVVDLSVWKE